ncbi:MAG: restriction endonuclease-like protein, partial [Armatimonadota bacterium]|nr:restriction endonuclease-like protein [Armatimonadota bacterium]
LAVGKRLLPESAWDDLNVRGGSTTTGKSPLERLHFIERMLPNLAQTLAQIEQAPICETIRESRAVSPPARARRVETRAILQAARQGLAARTLDETVSCLTFNTPENRLVKSFWQMLDRDLRTIARLAEAEGESDIVEAAHKSAERLRRMRLLWWDEVPAEVTDRGSPTQRMLSQAPYARIAAWIGEYRHGFQFDWDAPLFSLPSRETWQIYEAWCLFQVMEALQRLGYTPVEALINGSQSLLAIRAGRLRLTLAKGSESQIALRSPQGSRLNLFYNRAYAQSERSLSHTMLPDISLESNGQIWVWDAKFKSYAEPGAEGEDINQMHAYRDAIVDTSGQRCVARAWCLYAGQVAQENRAFISYGPPETSSVGALCLRPGQQTGFERLCALLTEWIK